MSRATLSVIRTREGVEELRAAWLGLGPTRVTADPSFLVDALEGDPRVVRPHVVAEHVGDELRALWVARVEQLELVYRIGHRVVFRPKVTAISVVVGGVLGEPDEAAFERFLAQVQADLRADAADVAIFRQLPLETDYHRWATRKPPFLARQHASRPSAHRELQLPESVDALLEEKSAKTRKKLRAAGRKLESDFDVDVRAFQEPADLDLFFDAVREVGRKTYQHALGVGFEDTEGNRRRTLAAMERGWFRGYVVYLDGTPAAYWHGELYEGTFRSGTPGFDPAHAAYGVGTYLMLRVIDALCADEGARVLDFGVGDSQYKQRFSNRGWLESDVFVFARTFRGLWLNLTHTLLLSAASGLGALARRAGLLATLKRWSRRDAVRRRARAQG